LLTGNYPVCRDQRPATAVKGFYEKAWIHDPFNVHVFFG
jgi:hypothetical protein